MTLRSVLMDRYFPTPEQEKAELEEQQRLVAFEMERVTEFLKVGYMKDFRAWLLAQQREVEPRVAERDDMLYRTGLRDGVRMVEDYIDSLETELNRRLDERRSEPL